MHPQSFNTSIPFPAQTMDWRKPYRCFKSPPVIQTKLSRLVSRHQQLKIAFNDLNSQIRIGLLEAEDVFASLAVPLMKLVGLKTVEMASEGSFSSIITSFDQSFPQDEDFVGSAVIAGNELMEKQKQQLIQLINLLRNIESQVNMSQNSIFETLANHQNFMKRFFQKAFTYVSDVHQSNRNDELSLMMLKLLKATFDQVRGAVGSVEVGVDDLIHDLADKMCTPMAQYVKDLKVEMKTGTCTRLLEVVKEMDEAMRVRKFQLEEASNRVRLAEQSRAETLSKLLKSEETARNLTISLGYLTEDITESDEASKQKQVLVVKEDQAKGDNLLWDVLRKKSKCHLPESPVGTKELLGLQKYDRRLNMTRALPTHNHQPVTRSKTKGLDPHFSLMASRMLLGSSPSATT